MQKIKLFLIVQKRTVIFCGIGFFLLFVGFSFLVHRNLFVHVDFNTTVRLQDHISGRLDGLFSFLSDIGKFEIVTTFLVIVLGWYSWRLKKWVGFVAALLFYGLMHGIEIYGKAFVHHLPPPHFMLRTHDIFTFPMFYVRATNSYPSGHAGRALFMTVILAVLASRSQKLKSKQKWFVYAGLFIYDMVMLTSRVYLGEHWLSDVIGGSLLGMAMGFFGSIFL